jgi:hypothetical protein
MLSPSFYWRTRRQWGRSNKDANFSIQVESGHYYASSVPTFRDQCNPASLAAILAACRVKKYRQHDFLIVTYCFY